MLPPDFITYSERTVQGRTVLFAAFDHGEHGVVEDDIGYFDYKAFKWVLREAVSDVDNYYVAVEQLNGLAGDFQRLCYNCHGLRKVRAERMVRSLRKRVWSTVLCPTCRGRGVLPDRECQSKLL